MRYPVAATNAVTQLKNINVGIIQAVSWVTGIVGVTATVSFAYARSLNAFETQALTIERDRTAAIQEMSANLSSQLDDLNTSIEELQRDSLTTHQFEAYLQQQCRTSGIPENCVFLSDLE